MTSEHARAAMGLGLLVELVAHQVLSQAQPESRLPVVLNGTEVGVGARGRASISFDFSYAGDALDVRQFRVLFGAYQWPNLRPDLFGHGAAEQPPIILLPRARSDRARDLGRHRSIDDGRRLARRPAPMPNVSLGVASLVDAYLASPLSVFHRDFLERRARPGAPAPPLDRSLLPPCVLAPFDRPNDLLLKPAHIQHVVRVLMAHGWDPVDIAQRVQEAYAEDHDWGDRWTWMDRQSRADFDVRVFAGLVATNHDTLVDLNCVSAQEKGVCAWVPCAADLRDTRDRLGANRGRS